MAYGVASSGSRSFNLRLIEIVAVAIHHITGLILASNTSSHKDDSISSWTPPKDNKRWWNMHLDGALPTLFYHSWYTYYRQYLEGAADMAGYWAENRILGGVVLFDRFNPDSDAVFLHPDRFRYTYRIYQLLDSQRRELLEFLLSDASDAKKCPLPMLPSMENRSRIDPEEPIKLTGIYRDDWERNPEPEERDARYITRRDVLNYPTMEDWNAAKARWQTRDERYWLIDTLDSHTDKAFN